MNLLADEQIDFSEHLMQSVFIKWKILSYCETNNIRIFRNQTQYFRQLLDRHLPTASSIAN